MTDEPTEEPFTDNRMMLLVEQGLMDVYDGFLKPAAFIRLAVEDEDERAS